MKQKKLFALVSCLIISLALFGISSTNLTQTSPDTYDLKTSDDGFEPNNNNNTAWPLSPGIYYDLNCSDDDWYRINITIPDRSVIIEILFNHSKGNLDLALYDPYPNLRDNSSQSNSTRYSEKVGMYVNAPREVFACVKYDGMPNENYTLNITVVPGNIFLDSIEITSPTSSDNWFNGTTSNWINWNWNGPFSNVSIVLLNETYGFDRVINPQTPNTGNYPWIISDDIPSGKYHIFMYDTFKPETNDTSELFNITNTGGSGPAESINITSPTATSIWNNGTTHEITWESNGTFPNVLIQLLDDGGGVIGPINGSTENDGSYWWNVPFNMIEGNYSIQVQNAFNALISDTSDLFTILGVIAPPLIIVNDPATGVNWFGGETRMIGWISNGYVPFVNITLFNSTNSPIYPIASYYSNSGSIPWTIPTSLPTGYYYIEVQNASNGYPNGVSNIFTITQTGGNTTGDFIYVTSPIGNDVWTQNSTYEITWIYSGSFTVVSIELWDESGHVMDIVMNTSNTGSVFWTIPENVSAGDYHIRIYDSFNPTTAGKSEEFRIGKNLVPGFPLLILFGVSMVAIVSIIRKQSNKRKMNL